MDIVKFAFGDYPRYEELLIMRDNVKKDAELYKISYDKVFGGLEQELFMLKIRCIEYKKLIRYCQIAINRGEKPDFAGINATVELEMKTFNDELAARVRYYREISDLDTVSDEELAKIKQIYRNIAKLIHPDINREAMEHEELVDLWSRVVAAYKGNDIKAITELEFLVNKTLEKLGLDHNSIVIDDIDEKIQELEDEIEYIVSTEPYQYKYLLDDEDKVALKTEEYELETERYRVYLKELSDKYAELGGL